MGVTVQEEHDGLEEDRSDPEGRGAHGPAPRGEVGRGRGARTNSSRTFAQRAGRPRSRAARPGGATVVAPAEVAIKSDGRIVGRRRRAVVVVNQSSFDAAIEKAMSPPKNV